MLTCSVWPRKLQPASGLGVDHLRLAVFTADEHLAAIRRDRRIAQAGFWRE